MRFLPRLVTALSDVAVFHTLDLLLGAVGEVTGVGVVSHGGCVGELFW